MVMKIIDSGPRERHRGGTASKSHYLDRSVKFSLFWNVDNFLKKNFFFKDTCNYVMLVLKMIGIAWAFQICYSFTIYSIPDVIMTIYDLEMWLSKNCRKLGFFENFQNMSNKTPPKK